MAGGWPRLNSEKRLWGSRGIPGQTEGFLIFVWQGRLLIAIGDFQRKGNVPSVPHDPRPADSARFSSCPANQTSFPNLSQALKEARQSLATPSQRPSVDFRTNVCRTRPK